jgi:hypothetical protein
MGKIKTGGSIPPCPQDNNLKQTTMIQVQTVKLGREIEQLKTDIELFGKASEEDELLILQYEKQFLLNKLYQLATSERQRLRQRLREKEQVY